MTPQQCITKSRKSLMVYAQRHGISEACRMFGYSRTSFYKLKGQLLKTGSLEPRIRRKPRMPNETSLSKKKLLLKMVQEQPCRGPQWYVSEFRKQGISIAPSVVWYHLKKFGLSRKFHRLVYLEQINMKGQPLTDRTLNDIKKQAIKVKEGLWPGHVVGIDTFYVGNLKGVGRIYQLSGIDLCSRYAWANLYTTKDHNASVDFVENVMIPKFFNNNVEIESILSDNGSEFVNSKFQQMISDYDIKHHRIPKGKPMFNGCCERFQRTLLEEFYQPVFRKRFFNSLNQLQTDLNQYLEYYNFQRVHFGVVKSGAVPIDVLKSKCSVLQQRFQNL